MWPERWPSDSPRPAGEGVGVRAAHRQSHRPRDEVSVSTFYCTVGETDSGQNRRDSRIIMAEIDFLAQEMSDVMSMTIQPTGAAAPTSPARDDLASARRFTALDGAMLGLLALMVACHLVSAALAVGWWTGLLTTALATVYLLVCAVSRPLWRPVIRRFLLLGFVAGVLELATDAAGRLFAQSLFYPAGEPLLWTSPIYMPFSWMVVVTQVGYLGWRLRGLAPRASLWAALLLTGLVGAALIPFYEETAYYARWWQYAPTVLHIGHTPAYVLLFEGLIAVALPLLTWRLTTRSWRAIAARGITLGAWMPVAALVAWLALGRW